MGIPGFASWYFANPYLENTLKTDVSKNDYSIINIENWFSLTKGLKLVVSLGSNQNMTRRQVFFPVETGAGFNANGGLGSNTMANTYSYNVNTYLNYDKNIGADHKLNLTLGGEYNNQIVELLNTSSSGYDIPSFGVDNIGRCKSGNYRLVQGRQEITIRFFSWQLFLQRQVYSEYISKAGWCVSFC